jgi:hypothetical protein
MNDATTYTVSEVSERTGFTIDTLRLAAISHKIDYYQGVLAPDGTDGR